MMKILNKIKSCFTNKKVHKEVDHNFVYQISNIFCGDYIKIKLYKDGKIISTSAQVLEKGFILLQTKSTMDPFLILKGDDKNKKVCFYPQMNLIYALSREYRAELVEPDMFITKQHNFTFCNHKCFDIGIGSVGTHRQEYITFYTHIINRHFDKTVNKVCFEINGYYIDDNNKVYNLVEKNDRENLGQLYPYDVEKISGPFYKTQEEAEEAIKDSIIVIDKLENIKL